MDPNANLREQLRIAARIRVAQEAEEEGGISNVDELASRLAELVEALNAWIVGGGFLPDAWQVNRDVNG